MEIQDNIVNRVAQSGLISFDPAVLYPGGDRIVYDIKDNLFHGLLLREKDFRDYIKLHDWSQYQGKHVAVVCSSDAIVPTWAYMLLANKLQPYASTVVFGSLDVLETVLFDRAIQSINFEEYRDQRVVIKGCGDISVPVSAYVALCTRLTAVAKSIMYGEPCSTVPIYKRKD